MNNVPRFIIDETGDREWQLFDPEVLGLTTVYLMYVEDVVKPPFNYQIILTVYDGAQAVLTTVPELRSELWSVHFYSSAGSLPFVNDVFDVLLTNVVDIGNPLELALAFGGQVKNRSVMSARIPYSH